MAAADRNDRSPPARLIAFLRTFLPRILRSPSSNRGLAAAASRGAPALDRGDLDAAQLVHDLRNQLTVMMGCADEVLYIVPKGYADRQLAELRRSIERASTAARDLLTAGRPRRPQRRALNLNEEIAHAVTFLNIAIGRRVRLQLRLSAFPVRVAADPAEVERILLNLVLNAREALVVDGVITIETAVGTEPAGGTQMRPGPYARVTVSDTGPGMTAAVRERMFGPYFTTKAASTGLGLTTVAMTVHELQGAVSVESEPGRGTAITILLPLAP
jgi:two-component system, cell cycle sensor histidine kinase and response regulator CckA